MLTGDQQNRLYIGPFKLNQDLKASLGLWVGDVPQSMWG